MRLRSGRRNRTGSRTKSATSCSASSIWPAILNVEPEEALRHSNEKFRTRFSYIEQQLKQQGRALESATLEEMDLLWEEAKKK